MARRPVVRTQSPRLSLLLPPPHLFAPSLEPPLRSLVFRPTFCHDPGPITFLFFHIFFLWKKQKNGYHPITPSKEYIKITKESSPGSWKAFSFQGHICFQSLGQRTLPRKDSTALSRQWEELPEQI